MLLTETVQSVVVIAKGSIMWGKCYYLRENGRHFIQAVVTGVNNN
ncbi:hypothetical protein [Blautia sp. XA-2221]|nr:hypothetical protein [Blautia sp. XA-2221]